MNEVVSELRDIITIFSKKFIDIPDEEFSAKPLPHKWSRKEVLGHLIDSAQTNLRRFITAQYETEPPRVFYQQDFWVASNGYQFMKKEEVIELWRLMNQRVCAVLENMPPSFYDRQIDTGELHSVLWVAEDYVKHFKHHINQIISGSFSVTYM